MQITVMAPFSCNRNFAYADMMKKSFVLTLESINSQGGINGRMLKLAYTMTVGKKKVPNQYLFLRKLRFFLRFFPPGSAGLTLILFPSIRFPFSALMA
jgi:hypothetical protein